MPDQKEMWNSKHLAGAHSQWADNPRELAEVVVQYLRPGDRLLELGCGVGSDARFFANKGVTVIATDFSDIVIEQNNARKPLSNLTFSMLDITKPLPYGNESFDAVYSHLSLHYYEDKQTREIFKEIARVLKPKGGLYFNCKSKRDPKYGDGERIGTEIFLRNGHIRHFFSTEYVKDLLAKDYDIVKLSESSGTFSGETSAFVNCIANKKGQ